jgi:hypothetical protein
MSRYGRSCGAAAVTGMALVFVCGALAEVVDRVAAIVGSEVITETEVRQEGRIVQFLNGQPLDLGPEQRRAAAERLVNQLLIRNEMAIGQYPEPPESEADAMLRNIVEQRFGANQAAFRDALGKYGITEDQLKRHMRWQLAVMRFTDSRFRLGLPGQERPGAERAATGADRVAPGGGVDEQLEAWLKESRNRTRIVFRKEAFR